MLRFYLVTDAVRRNVVAVRSTQSDIVTYIQNWFQNSRDLKGGRSRRIMASYRSKRRRITQEVNNQLLALHSLTPNLRLAQLELGQSEETCRNIDDEEHFNSLVTVVNLDLPILDFSPSLDKCNFV
jgi:hypothetical protein